MKEIGPFKNEFAFLSNFHYIVGGMMFDGLNVPTSEHAYMMMKAKHPADKLLISAEKYPSGAKLLGSAIELRDDWEEVKVDIMRQVLESKFSLPIYKEMLNTTKGCKLIEYNWWGDKFWGVDLKTKEGQNWLGRLLMEIRDDK